jgi:ABC-type branched-subunit amino acid transport system permease subunit
MLIVAVVLTAGLGFFFKYTTLGVAVRATADSREVSRLLGIDANRVSAFSWAVGSMIACIGGILISPARGLNAFALAVLIVPGFAASLLGGFTSLTGTLLGGLALGVAVDVLRGLHWPHWFGNFFQTLFAANGSDSFIILLVVVGVLMWRPKFIFKGIRLDEDSGVSFAKTGSGLNAEDRIRRALDRRGALSILLADWNKGKWILGLLAGGTLLLVPVVTTSYWSTVLCFGVIYALVSLSIIVLTGWTGQLSLAPLTFLGVGGYGTAILSSNVSFFGLHAHWPFWAAVPMAGLISIPFAIVLGAPALRLRGFFLALVTLCFAAAGSDWLFLQPGLAKRQHVERGILTKGFSQPTYYVALLVAVGLFMAIRNLSKTHTARTFFALRDSESTAISMGINPTRYKLLAFSLAGFIGGLAGALLAYLAPTIQPVNYMFAASLAWVLNTVVASATVLGGAVLAGFLFSVVPQLTASPTGGVNQAPVILGGIGAILTVTDYPNGLASFFSRLIRKFDVGESIAWASDEAGENVAAAVAEAEHDESDFDRAATAAAATTKTPERV